jgi:hypothetical protein
MRARIKAFDFDARMSVGTAVGIRTWNLMGGW